MFSTAERSEESSLTWPTWIAVCGRAAYRQRKWEPATSANGSSSWPTATVTSGSQVAGQPSAGQTGGATQGGAAEMIFPATPEASARQTPRAGSQAERRSGERSDELLLDGQAALWRAPATTDVGTPLEKLTAKDGSAPQIGHRMYRDGPDGERINQTQSLEMQAKLLEGLWATPSACVPNDGESPETWRARAAILKEKHGNGNGAGTPLTVQAQEQCSLWATPTAHERTHDPWSTSLGSQLANQADLWSTPLASDSLGEMHQSERAKENGWAPRLQDQARDQGDLWSTPRASESENRTTHNAPSHEAGTHGKTLAGEVGSWMTPSATDHKGSTAPGAGRGQLSEQTETAFDQQWMTPTANPEAPNLGSNKTGPASIMAQAEEAGLACPSSLPALETETVGEGSSPTIRGSLPRSAKKRLNPLFVQILQGLPLNWTSPTVSINSDAWEIWRSLCARQLHSLCSGAV